MSKRQSAQRFPTGMSHTMIDSPVEAVRAHAIADTIGALRDLQLLELLQTDQTEALARALHVPTLWVEAAQGFVALEEIRDFNQWFAGLRGKGNA